MSNTNQQNMITQGTTLVGDIFSEGDFRIEGNIKGNIKTSGKIVVGKTGVINGSLEGENADFEGGFSGKLKLSGFVKRANFLFQNSSKQKVLLQQINADSSLAEGVEVAPATTKLFKTKTKTLLFQIWL